MRAAACRAARCRSATFRVELAWEFHAKKVIMNCIRDVMSERLVTLNEFMPISVALLCLKTEQVHHALVAALGELRGVVCRCDLEAADSSATVSSCMKRHFVFIDDRSTPLEAARLM